MNVKEYIKTKNLLFDGGMGTYFSRLTRDSADTCEEANLKKPEMIEKIHAEYISCGAKAIKTNTFAAYRSKDKKAVIKAACDIAKRAVGDSDVFIFADMGPVEDVYKADSLYKEMVDIFIENGIHNFLFETLSDNRGVIAAAKYIKEILPESFVIVSYAVGAEGYTRTGRFIDKLIEEAGSCRDIDAVGLNCGSGPSRLSEILESIKTDKPVSVMPNAGYPTVLGSRTVYGASEDYFALKMADIAANGAKILGGCCGTTPLFIKKCAEAGVEAIKAEIKEEARQKTKMPQKSVRNSFFEKLSRGERVIAVELDPPEDMDTGFFINGAKKLRDAGCDIITVADCPVARPRMDSSILACKLKRELDIDSLPHMTCRDRNLNATKALLLGLSAEGVNNILAVTGDPLPSEKRDEVKSVFNFNSRMLIRFISSLNENVFSSPINICAALNINAVNFDVQLALAKEKIQSGAKVFLTQPMMTHSALLNLMRAKEELDAKVLCGIMPIVSYKNALYMNSEIAGITVDERITAMFEGKSRDEAERLGIKTALAAVDAAAPFCDGFYLITPFKRVDMMCEIVREILKKTF